MALSVRCVSNRGGPLHGRHFPPPGYSRKGTGHSQLPNIHTNQPERRDRRRSTVIGHELPPLQCIFIWYLTRGPRITRYDFMVAL